MRFGIATGAFPDERDDWDAGVARAAAGGFDVLELTAVTEELLDALVPFLAERAGVLDRFERVSIHAPVAIRTSPTEVADRVAAVAEGFDVVLHPDLYLGERAVARLERRAIFENMDVGKRFGRSVGDLESVFEGHPDAGFCLDVAHVRTVDPSLRLAHDLLESLGDRLRQLHVSGIEPDGTHRPTTAADLEAYAPVLARCRHVPWLLEAELVPEAEARFAS
jgi:hypothetical protein